VPISADLLGIFFTSGGDARRLAWNFPGDQADRALSSMGWGGRGPGAGTPIGCRSGRSLRVILLAQNFYGSNRVDCHRLLRHRIGGVGMVGRETRAATAIASQRLAYDQPAVGRS